MERLASGTFITTSNTEVKLSFAGEGLETKLRNESARAVGKLRFLDPDGTEYRLQDLRKDAGFGGMNSLKREEQALALFQQRLDIEKHNFHADMIPIVVAGQCYYVSSVESTPGTPKSDFHFTDLFGREVVWISHKHGKSPRCFQQWGGASAKVEPNIHWHEETQEFAASVRAANIAPATTIARAIKDERLQNLAVYGNEFGGPYSQNNVHMVIQGLPTISSNTGNVHFDIVSHSVHTNGDKMPEPYAPTFMAMFRGDRNDFGIRNCRVGISPKHARLITNWIDNDEPSEHPPESP